MIAVVLTLIVAAVASVPHCSVVGVVLLPGIPGAATIFPQGVESDSAVAFVVLAGLIESFLLSIPVECVLLLCRRRGAVKS